jgi:hypothetical protein
MEWLWFYIGTIAVSYAGRIAVVVSMIVELKKAGYEFDVEKIKQILEQFSTPENQAIAKVSPLIPLFNVAHTMWLMSEFAKNKELIYKFLDDFNAIKEIEKDKEEDLDETDKESDTLNEEIRLNNVLTKFQKLYDETILSGQPITEEDLKMMLSTLSFVKSQTADEKLLGRISELENKIGMINMPISIPPEISETKQDDGYQKVIKPKK